MKTSLWRRAGLFAGTIALLAGAMTGATAAQGAPPGKGPGGGEETTANNLSVPTVFVGQTGFGLTNPALQAPTGTPLTGYEVDPTAYYYVQGVHRWQAQYVEADSSTATARWGDNLAGGEASFKVGSPIRVEMGLTATGATAAGTAIDVSTLQGYSVVKLQPSALDRNSAYGTLATANSDGAYSATPQILAAQVWGPGATVTISGPENSTAAMPGEINATGKVVFGYNWRPSSAGIYTLTFNPPAGVAVSDTASLSIQATVAPGAGKRGGGGGGRP